MKRLLPGVVILFLALGVLGVSGQEFAKKKVDKTPRHVDWVDVKNGDRKVKCFVVYPEVKDKATAVLVIHENKGLTDWVRLMADDLAEAGYIAIAPDLLSGMAPGGKNTDGFASEGEATKAIGVLSGKPAQVTSDLNAVADFILKDKACNGKLTVCGFCWGGGQSFRFATDRKDLKAAFVFYGMFNQSKDSLGKISCPVYGFYAENDARINTTVPESTSLMKGLSKVYEPITYVGGGHGFMRDGEDPNGKAGNRSAREAAWKRWMDILKKI